MKIVTTPMCSEVVHLAGVKEFVTNSNPDSTNADLAVILSETETKVSAIKLKLNTINQINCSIKYIADELGTSPTYLSYESAIGFPKNVRGREKLKVKVYSNFLKDIVKDMGFTIDEEQPDFIVYPDYFRDRIIHEIKLMGQCAVEIPSHKNAPVNPIERAKMRYKILEKRLCMKL